MLEVPYAEKDLAKAAGARWNRDAEFWFAPAAAELDKLEKWIVTVLDVPFAQKDLAKAAGVRVLLATYARLDPPDPRAVSAANRGPAVAACPGR